MSHIIPAVIAGAMALLLAWAAGSDHARINGSSRLFLTLAFVLMGCAIFVSATTPHQHGAGNGEKHGG